MRKFYARNRRVIIRSRWEFQEQWERQTDVYHNIKKNLSTKLYLYSGFFISYMQQASSFNNFYPVRSHQKLRYLSLKGFILKKKSRTLQFCKKNWLNQSSFFVDLNSINIPNVIQIRFWGPWAHDFLHYIRNSEVAFLAYWD